MKYSWFVLNRSALILIGVLFGMSLLLTACGSGGSKTPTTSGSKKVTITPNIVNLTVGGLSFQFAAKQVSGSGAIFKEAVFTWQSDNTNVLTIDPTTGLARGINVGVAQVTATSGTSTGSPMTASATVGVVSPKQGAADITLSGNVSYEDKLFNQDGFTDVIDKKPVRNAVLELVAIDGFKTIKEGTTDGLGNYTITGNNSGRRGGIYLRVISKTNSNSSTKITVQSNPSDKARLAFRSSSMDDSLSGTQFFVAQNEIVVTISSDIGGAFNILDALSSASEFVQQSGPCPTLSNGCIPPLLTAYWEPGNSVGTFFDSEIDAISILGGGGTNKDADEYDDAVIIHEYGHFILSHFSHDDSPGGFHFLNQTNQDIRLSWSEGWANFFSSAVRNEAFYVDTIPGGVFISYNLEDYSSAQVANLNGLSKYTTSEITVGGVLWDIFDSSSVNETDNLQIPFPEILQNVMAFPPLPAPATFETFWLAFQGNQFPTELVNLQTIMQNREIELFMDVREASGEQELLIETPQHHTLYRDNPNPQNDTDIIPFKVKRGTNYTIKTLNLSNGADTLLTITDQFGNGLGVGFENDNESGKTFTNCSTNPLNGTSNCPRNGPNNLASSVSFQWTGADETLQAHVSRSPIAPPSAGLFGSYDIELTTSP